MYRMVFTALGLLTTTLTVPRVPGWIDELSRSGPADLTAIVVYASGIAAAALLSWATLLSLVAAVDMNVARRLGPAWLVTLAVGAGAVGVPAAASEHPLDGLSPPDRPVSQPADPSTSSAREHIVVDGDSLWSIVAASGPADADATEIAHGVHAWHQHNRAVIGPDPDVLLPGRRLTEPQE